MSLHNIEYDDELIAEIIRIGLGEELETYEPIEEGVMNRVLDVTLANGQEVIIKLSDQPKKYSLEKEEFIINTVQNHGVPVATILFSDYSKTRWDYEVMIMEKLPGQPAQHVWNSFSKERQIKIARQAGAIFANLHNITFEKPARISAKKILARNTLKEYMDGWVSRDLEVAREMNFIPKQLIDTIEKTYNKNEQLLKSLDTFSLCHMDYHLGHIFVDENAKVTGIIDWGFAEVMPAIADFFKPHRWIFEKGVEIKEAFLETYKIGQDLPEDFEEQVRFFRTLYDLKFIERLVKTNQITLAREYVIKLKEHLGVLEHKQ